MGSHRFVVCDVFTSVPLAGNALAVFTDARDLDGGRMQAVARETNLSETTFVLPPVGDGDFRVRIFTPGCELPFAGHPLIGTAVVLGRSLPLDRLVLETGVGPVAVDLESAGGVRSRAVLHQPPPTFAALDDGGRLAQALGLPPAPVVVGDNGLRAALLAAPNLAALASLNPDPVAMAAIAGLSTAAVYVDGDPVRVRVFAPWVGVPEDPGTGSAAGPLAVHLGRSIRILQGVEIGRPSEIDVELGDDGAPRVGGAVTLVARGSYEL